MPFKNTHIYGHPYMFVLLVLRIYTVLICVENEEVLETSPKSLTTPTLFCFFFYISVVKIRNVSATKRDCMILVTLIYA